MICYIYKEPLCLSEGSVIRCPSFHIWEVLWIRACRTSYSVYPWKPWRESILSVYLHFSILRQSYRRPVRITAAAAGRWNRWIQKMRYIKINSRIRAVLQMSRLPGCRPWWQVWTALFVFFGRVYYCHIEQPDRYCNGGREQWGIVQCTGMDENAIIVTNPWISL